MGKGPSGIVLIPGESDAWIKFRFPRRVNRSVPRRAGLCKAGSILAHLPGEIFFGERWGGGVVEALEEPAGVGC